MNLQLLIAKDLPFECFGFVTSLDVDVPMGLARRTSPSLVPVLTSTFLSVWLQVQVPVLTLTVLSVWLQIHVPVLTLRFLSVTRLQVQVPVLPLAFGLAASSSPDVDVPVGLAPTTSPYQRCNNGRWQPRKF